MLIQTTDWRHGAIDPETGARLTIKSTAEIGTFFVEYSRDALLLKTAIYARPKHSDRPIDNNDRDNPGVLIPAVPLNSAFSYRNMRDIEANSSIAEEIARMIAFVNKNHPLSKSLFLWSDFDRLPPDRFLFRLPSDTELLEISLNPERSNF